MVIRRLAAAILAAAALTLGGGVATAVAAPTVPTIDIGPIHTDCKDAPTPESPYNGAASYLLKAPKVLPPDDDPFKPGASTTIFEQYGMAGGTFETYDVGVPAAGCVSTTGTATTLANLMYLGPKLGLALNTMLGNAVLYPDFMSVLDPAMVAITSAIRESFTAEALPVLILLSAVLVVIGIRRSQIGKVLTTLGVIGVVLVGVAATTNFPVKIGHAADDTVSTLAISGVSAVNHLPVTTSAQIKSAPATRLNSGFYKTTVYEPWLRGTLGSSTSATAVKYGPTLWKAHALTWREGAIVRDDPNGKGKALVEAKMKLWDETAAKVKDSDPIAYSYLQGKMGGERIGVATVAFIAVGIGLIFTYGAFLMLLGCYLVFRLLVMTGPLLLPLAVLPRFHSTLIGMRNLLGAAVINTVLFTTAAGMILAIGGYLFASDVDPIMAIVIYCAASVVAWLFLAPYRSLTKMASSHDPIGDALNAQRNAGAMTKRWLGKAAASFAGNKLALATEDHDEDEHRGDDEAPSRRDSRPARDTRWVRPETQYRPQAQPYAEPMALPVGDAGEIYQTSERPDPVVLAATGASPTAPGGALPTATTTAPAALPAGAAPAAEPDTEPDARRGLPSAGTTRAEAAAQAEPETPRAQYQAGDEPVTPSAVYTAEEPTGGPTWTAPPPATVSETGTPVWMVYDAESKSFGVVDEDAAAPSTSGEGL